jgi:hypothetical protein
MDRLDVRTNRMQRVLIVILALIFIPLAAGSLFTGLSSGGGMMPLLIGGLMLAAFGGVMWIIRRGHTKSVRYFSAEGLERNDGQWLPWTELERVVHQVRVDATRPGDKRLWRTEIWFRGGRSAWLLPTRISNRGEVDGFVRALPCEHAEVKV